MGLIHLPIRPHPGPKICGRRGRAQRRLGVCCRERHEHRDDVNMSGLTLIFMEWNADPIPSCIDKKAETLVNKTHRRKQPPEELPSAAVQKTPGRLPLAESKEGQ